MDKRDKVDEGGRAGFSAAQAAARIGHRALGWIDAIEALPFGLRLGVSLFAIAACVGLRAAFAAYLDAFSGHYLLYPAVAISALLCGVAGGLASVLLIVLFAHDYLGAPSWGGDGQQVNFIVLFDFLADSAVYIALARLPAFLASTARAREALMRANAEQFGQFVEQAPAAMAMFDRDMRYIALSARWREDYGLGSDVVGRHAYDVFPETTEAWKQVHQRALAGEVVRAERDVLVRRDGSSLMLRWEVRPWLERSGQIGGVVIFAENISERGRIQRALEESERRLNAIFDTAMDAIVTIDRHGVIQSANPAAHEMFGCADDEMVGRNVRMLIPAPYGHRHDSFLAAYLETGVRKIIGQRRTVEGLRRDGAVFPLELTVSEALLANGPVFVGVMRDLRPIEAERRRVSALRDELARVSRVNDMGEMAAGLAHEVGQPVAAILNFAAAYRRAVATTGRAPEGELIGKIEAQARRAAEILKRLRGFIEKRPPERQAVEIESLIDDALQLVALRRRPRILRPPPPPEVEGARIFADPIQIEQVLVSLLRNADDALIDTNPAEIAIETSVVEGGRIRISVADNGAGVAPEAVEELFSPFFTTKILGMGVGLSISKSIVESHGGVIGYRPNAPCGSIFDFELPICQAESPSEQRAAAER